MIAFLEGKVAMKAVNYTIINVNGVGYKVFMPANEIEQLETNSVTKVYTFFRATENEIALYGFLVNEELAMFELLLSVGGIGAKSALGILSNIEPSTFALAVITNDISTLKKLPGIGAKTAQRIVLELKDKIKAEEKANTEAKIQEKIQVSPNAQDAIEALQVLGYNRKEVEEIVTNMKTADMSVEEIIKEGLKQLN